MSFTEIIGQDRALRILNSFISSGHIPHCMLFHGNEGVGKHKTALEFAKFMNCANTKNSNPCDECRSCNKAMGSVHPDIKEVGFFYQSQIKKEPVEKQQSLKIDTIRAIEKDLRLKPMEGKNKIAIIDPANELTEEAAHALLKILEEPPSGTYIILIAPDETSLLPTIRSRCQKIFFNPISANQITAYLIKMLEIKNDKASSIAARAGGSISKAIEAANDVGEEDAFDWEVSDPLEVITWCQNYDSRHLGREGAKEVINDALLKTQKKLGIEPETTKMKLNLILKALSALDQNVSSQLVLETLLLNLRKIEKAHTG